MVSRRSMSAVAGFVLAAALLPLAVAHAEGPPSTVSFPGSCGQPTLQQCIDSVSTGSTVYVEAGTVVEEYITVDKSLDLIGTGTPRPTIAFGLMALAQGSGEVMRVQHLDFDNEVRARVLDGSGHSIEIQDVRVTPQSGWSGLNIEIQAEGVVAVKNSRVTRYNTEGGGITASVTQAAGSATLKLLGNRVSNGGANAGAGISVYLGHTGTADVHLVNNALEDLAACGCGNASGVSVWRNSEGSNDVNIVGNSITRSATSGVLVQDEVATGGSMAVDLFNNVIARSAARAVYFEAVDSTLLSVRAGHNAFWKNPLRNLWDGEAPGDGNLSVDPRFVDEPAGDLRLKAGSPLKDAGLSCSPGGIANPDAAGNFRITQRAVDIGAFEIDSEPSSTPAVVGTDGDNTLDAYSSDTIVCGFGGADVIGGSTGSDYLDGGAGPDQLSGGPGADLLLGQGGPDFAYGDAGPDRIFGGAADDYCLAAQDFQEGNDKVVGGSGSDHFTADAKDERTSVEIRGCVT